MWSSDQSCNRSPTDISVYLRKISISVYIYRHVMTWLFDITIYHHLRDHCKKKKVYICQYIDYLKFLFPNVGIGSGS